MEKVNARSIPAAVQERVRQLAVKAVLAGKKQVEVAKIFGVTRPAVGKWLKAYRSGGGPELKAKRQGRPQGGSQLPWQAAQIAKAVVDHYPDQLKLPFYLWTREAVSLLIRRFKASLDLGGIFSDVSPCRDMTLATLKPKPDL